MRPEECIVGMLVQYAPSPGRWFTGVVAYEPWQLGEGTWVTKLRDMEDGYGAFTGKRGDKAYTVFAAALNSMRPMPKHTAARGDICLKQYGFENPAIGGMPDSDY
jgi:hypothetical protein